MLIALTVGVVKEPDVPVVPLVVLAVVCDSVINVDGVVSLSTTHTHIISVNHKMSELTHPFDNTIDTEKRILEWLMHFTSGHDLQLSTAVKY